MVSSQTYSVSFPPSDGRRFTRSYHTPYSYLPDRRFLSHHHDQRVMTMADSEVENDPSQQRKRISVAVSLVADIHGGSAQVILPRSDF
jgi:hypothetical protein